MPRSREGIPSAIGRDGTPIEDAEIIEPVLPAIGIERERALVRNQNDEGRAQEREGRTDRLVERHPELEQHRAALLDAEAAYKDAVKAYKTKGLKMPFREDAFTQEAREKLDTALAEWSGALSGVMSASPEDRLLAKFVNIRDMALRSERARQEAIREVLDERGKTVAGKMVAWSKSAGAVLANDAKKVAGAYGAASAWVGGKLVDGALSAADAVGRGVDKEKHAEKIARARRIVGSAALMSLIVAPAGATTGAFAAGAVGFDFLARVARGTFAGQVGAAVRGAAEAFISQTESDQQRHAHWMRDHMAREVRRGAPYALYETLDDFRDQYKAASSARFVKDYETTQRVRGIATAASAVIGASAAAGIASYPLEAGAHSESGGQMAEERPTSAVQEGTKPSVVSKDATPAELKQTLRERVEEISGRSAPADSVAEKGTTESASAMPATEVSAAVDELGEGTDSVFLELKKEVSALDNRSPVAALLSESHPNEISRLVGEEAYGKIGMRTQMGDSFYLDDKQNLMYKPADGEAQLYIENDPSDPKGYVVHELSAEPTVPSAAEATPTPAEPSVGGPAEAAALDADEEEPGVHEAAEGATQQPVQEESAPLSIEDTITPETAAPGRVGGIEALTLESYAPEAAPDTDPEPSPEAPAVDSIDLSKSQITVDQNGNLFAYVSRTGNMTLDNQTAQALAVDAAIKNPGTPIYYVEHERGGFLGLRTIDRVHVLAVDATKGPAPIEYEMPKNAVYTIPEPSSLKNLTSRTV